MSSVRNDEEKQNAQAVFNELVRHDVFEKMKAYLQAEGDYTIIWSPSSGKDETYDARRSFQQDIQRVLGLIESAALGNKSAIQQLLSGDIYVLTEKLPRSPRVGNSSRTLLNTYNEIQASAEQAEKVFGGIGISDRITTVLSCIKILKNKIDPQIKNYYANQQRVALIANDAKPLNEKLANLFGGYNSYFFTWRHHRAEARELCQFFLNNKDYDAPASRRHLKTYYEKFLNDKGSAVNCKGEFVKIMQIAQAVIDKVEQQPKLAQQYSVKRSS